MAAQAKLPEFPAFHHQGREFSCPRSSLCADAVDDAVDDDDAPLRVRATGVMAVSFVDPVLRSVFPCAISTLALLQHLGCDLARARFLALRSFLHAPDVSTPSAGRATCSLATTWPSVPTRASTPP